MRLQKLEIQGFKSFAGRGELIFEGGITAVVGPNGCGKSNIVDAIRWVLGEQSVKSLRGARLEDIIFAGSEGRKPLGMARVALTLENREGDLPLPYQEVTIQRRVFRSGESEFFINDTACRLRDISELFMDTGLGKETYSIIEQGKIDAVLSANSQERRALLEEAAGIYKYRRKKAEALEKLAAVELDQERALDLLAELQSRLGPLREAARRAEEQARLTAAQRELAFWLLGKQARGLVQRLTEKGKAREELKTLVTAGQTALAAREEELARRRANLAALEAELEAQQAELGAQEAELERLRGELALGEERSRHLEESEARLKQEKAELTREEGILQKKLAALAAREAELAQVEKEKMAVLAAGEAEWARVQEETAAQTEGLEKIKAEMIEVLQRLAAGHNEERNLAAEEERLVRRAEKLEAEETATAATLADLSAAAKKVAEARQEREVHLAELTSALAASQAEAERLAQELEALQAREKELEASRQRKAAQRQLLLDWEQEHEGYYQGPKALLAARESLGGIEGTVAELLRVPAEYELALEVALGGAVQNLITTDESAAARAIAYLKEKRLGRATFLPLNLVQGQEISPQEWERFATAGILGPALNFVTFAPRYAPAFRYLLGRTLVAKDLQAALAMARVTGARFRLVTLEGELISPGGAVTGGAQVRKGTGILGRRRQIEELGEELARLTAARTQVAEELARRRRQEEELRQRAQRLAAEQRQEELALIALSKEAERLQREQALAQERQELLQAEREEHQRSQRELSARRARVREELAALEKKRGELEATLQYQQAAAGAQNAAREELAARLQTIKLDLSTLRQTQAGVAAEKERHEELLSRVRAGRTGCEEELARLGQQRQELAIGQQERQERLARGEEEQVVAKASYREKRRAREEEQKRLAEEERARQKEVEELATRERELHRLELELARLEEEAKQLQAVAAERFGEDLSVLAQADDTPPQGCGSEGEVKKRLEVLQEEIAALGPVNPGAVAEYEEVAARVAFLEGQLSDLDAARAELADLVAEIDRVCRRRFAETYQAVAEAFSRLFQRLFAGGKAWLEATAPPETGEGKREEEQDPLTHGIEIMVQLPGKRVQNLTLLSGGERALTAIAFLFAMLQVKPPPFCILDEIDAALDEANLRRFTELLREFARTIQFIIITHRRPTMEAASVLYGVTMEEAGVSQVVSLRLAEGGEKVRHAG